MMQGFQRKIYYKSNPTLLMGGLISVIKLMNHMLFEAFMSNEIKNN